MALYRASGREPPRLATITLTGEIDGVVSRCGVRPPGEPNYAELAESEPSRIDSAGVFRYRVVL